MSRQARSDFGHRHVEALTVAMIVAPGVYVRNRMFARLSSPSGQRARARASVVRGIVPQLARATAVALTNESRGTETVFVLRYVIATIRLTRVVELSAAELAALRLAAERASVRCLLPCEGDRELVAQALSGLLEPDERSHDGRARDEWRHDDAIELSRVTRELVAPSGE